MGHWSYKKIDDLQSKGYLRALNPVTKPYIRINVARELLKINKQNISSEIVQVWINQLKNELKDEINSLRDRVYPKSQIQLNTRLSEYLWHNKKNALLGGGSARIDMTFDYGKYFTAHQTNVWKQSNAYDFVNQNRVYEANNRFTEQAYISYNDDHFTIKFGKDYLNWGYGLNSFSIDKSAGSINQLFMQWQSTHLAYTYFTTFLDQSILLDSLGISTNESIQRYYSGSRLDVTMFDNDLKFGIWQSVLYGGKNATTGLRYSNPIMVYYAVQWNDSEKGNLLVGADLSWYPGKKINLYSGFVVDDWQIKNQGVQGELIPNKWGGMLGVKISDALESYNIRGTEINVELVKVTNRTFNQKTPYQRLLYGENFVAHPLATDFETLDVTLKHWVTSNLQLSLIYQAINKGEGNLDEHTEPWFDKDENGDYIYTLETGYHENSPFGIVEKTQKAGFGLYFQPLHNLIAEFTLKHVWISNAENVKNNDKHNWELFFTFSYEFQSAFSLL